MKLCSILVVLLFFSSCIDSEGINTNQGLYTSIDTTWHKNGNIATTKSHHKNQLHGISKEYFPSGNLQVEKHYILGDLQSEKLLTIEGKVIKNIIIKDGRTYGLMRSSFCINGMVKNDNKENYEIRRDGK